MKIDIVSLLLVFDELTPATNEQEGIYWLKTRRTDGLIITLAFSIYEKYTDIIINNIDKVDIASLSFENCSEIKILDGNRKCLEILHNHGRCFLCLSGSPILEYQE